MKLLTVGVGSRGAKILELFHREGATVNKTPLFKCFALINDEEQLRTLSIKDEQKFYLRDRRGVPGFINSLTSVYEILEGTLVLASLEDDFAFETSVEFCERLKTFSEDPIMYLTLIPSLDKIDVMDLKRKIREIRRVSDVILIFEEKVDVDEKILNSLNLLALAGETDLKKGSAGEVILDTSDVFNALKSDGFSVVGFAEKKLTFEPFKKKSELKAMRMRRILEMVNQALNNLSIKVDISEATSALLLFSGPEEELVMEGILEATSEIEKLNEGIVVRYGDFPMPPSLLTKKVALVALFSGIRGFKF